MFTNDKTRPNKSHNNILFFRTKDNQQINSYLSLSKETNELD
jgi:hypothetical protein